MLHPNCLSSPLPPGGASALPGAIRLRGYQEEAVSRLFGAWRGGLRSVMLQMPTGTGKTHVLAAVAREFLSAGSPVLFVSHRRELVSQAEAVLARHGVPADGRRVIAASVQRLSRRWEDVRASSPGLVVIDEAHHARAATYMSLWSRLPGARFLGLTATPCRMDGAGFTDLFDTLVESRSAAEFIRDGVLSPFDYVSVRAGGLEERLVRGFRRRGPGGDYQAGEMDRALNSPRCVARLYESVREWAAGRKGIVYAVSVGHARSIAEYYSSRGLRSAAVHCGTTAQERARLAKEFRAGRLRVLVNVDLFSEGFDCPDAGFVQMARPTLSLSKYLQQAGRGLRRAAGKESCVLIDNAGLYRVFGLPTADRDWESMFRGRAAGRGDPLRLALPPSAPRPCAPERGGGTEAVYLHTGAPSSEEPDGSALEAWRDGGSGLWGLRRGGERTCGALFEAVFGTRYGMAAVRLPGGKCGVSDACGSVVWKGAFRSVRFADGRFAVARGAGGAELWLDLYSLRSYAGRPESLRCGGVELLRSGGVLYSRTKSVYVNGWGIGAGGITRHAFGVAVFDYKSPPGFSGRALPDGFRPGYACLLDGDHETYYWLRRLLADGSAVVSDTEGRHYRVGGGRGKEYIGRATTEAEGAELRARVDSLARLAEGSRRRAAAEESERRLRLLERAGSASPFRSGAMWGLKVGGRVTVPPVYRSVMPPVGRYCAVEKGCGRWGVAALDGTLVVEPRYSAVEIGAGGAVTGTKLTGEKVSVKLP